MEYIISSPDNCSNFPVEVGVKSEIGNTDEIKSEKVTIVKCLEKLDDNISRRLRKSTQQKLYSNSYFDAGEADDGVKDISKCIEQSNVEETGIVKRLRKCVTQKHNTNKYSAETEIKNENLGTIKLDSDVMVTKKCVQELKAENNIKRLRKELSKKLKNYISSDTEVKHDCVSSGATSSSENVKKRAADSEYEMSTEDENDEVSEMANSRKNKKVSYRSKLLSREKRYPCEICGKKFENELRLKSHCHSHTGMKVFKCEICGKEYGWQSSYQNHMMKHNGVNPYKCSACGKVLSTRLSLKNHIFRIHEKPEKQFACDICERRFLNAYELKYHKENHFNKQSFMCELCGKTSNSKNDLKVHHHTHTGERPFKCDICNKGFIRNSMMKEHRRIHTDGYSNQCEICGKQYSTKGSLARHRKIHSEDRPYKCNLCEKAFKCSSALYSHKDYHIGIKRHVCKICGKAFLNEPNMHKHKKRHIGVKKEKCLVCDKAFYTKQELRAHMKSHEPKHLGRKKKRTHSESNDAILLKTEHPHSPETPLDSELPQPTSLIVEKVQLEDSRINIETERMAES